MLRNYTAHVTHEGTASPPWSGTASDADAIVTAMHTHGAALIGFREGGDFPAWSLLHIVWDKPRECEVLENKALRLQDALRELSENLSASTLTALVTRHPQWSRELAELAVSLWGDNDARAEGSSREEAVARAMSRFHARRELLRGSREDG